MQTRLLAVDLVFLVACFTVAHVATTLVLRRACRLRRDRRKAVAS